MKDKKIRAMSLETWARRCGWPMEELRDTPYTVMLPIFALMDLRLCFRVTKAKNGQGVIL